ncbi:cytochrome P450 4c3-like [Cydia pomonella]|uniref:cytochrome P450 4c3-like n=1 Tax=Cydia pomonella TaxID=82600 RepID=UPI002ADD59A6|nr:cytochrome P450 4c3-like [Cydia pomonella]
MIITMIPISVVVIILMCCVLALYYKKRRRYLDLASKVPTQKDRLPIIGHLYKLSGGSERLWEYSKEVSDAAEKAGGIITIWAGPKAIFCINDPDDAFTVLNSCLDKSYFYKIAFGWFGHGLLTSDVATWKHNRKLLNPTFSQHVLDGFLPIFNRQATLLALEMEQSAGTGLFDPTDYFREVTLETVCQTAFGISLDDRSVIDSEYKKALAVALDGSAQRLGRFWLHSDFLYQFSALRKTMDEAVAVVHKMSRNVLNTRRAERKEAKTANTSSRRFIAFLDLLLDLSDDGSFSDDQILNELNIFIAAGHDTSSRVLVSIMVLLGTHQDVQEKLYKEVITVLGPSSYLNKEDIARLVYTEAVIKEVLRLSLVVPIVAREVDKDIKLKNYTLPAGSGCAVLFWGIHRLPIWGPDRLQFRPERWLDPSTLPRNPGAFCGFSLGRRNCIGKPYALMAIKTIVVHLVRKYRISADYSKVKLEYDVLLKYGEGQHITLQLRKETKEESKKGRREEEVQEDNFR